MDVAVRRAQAMSGLEYNRKGQIVRAKYEGNDRTTMALMREGGKLGGQFVGGKIGSSLSGSGGGEMLGRMIGKFAGSIAAERSIELSYGHEHANYLGVIQSTILAAAAEMQGSAQQTDSESADPHATTSGEARDLSIKQTFADVVRGFGWVMDKAGNAIGGALKWLGAERLGNLFKEGQYKTDARLAKYREAEALRRLSEFQEFERGRQSYYDSQVSNEGKFGKAEYAAYFVREYLDQMGIDKDGQGINYRLAKDRVEEIMSMKALTGDSQLSDRELIRIAASLARGMGGDPNAEIDIVRAYNSVGRVIDLDADRLMPPAASSGGGEGEIDWQYVHQKANEFKERIGKQYSRNSLGRAKFRTMMHREFGPEIADAYITGSGNNFTEGTVRQIGIQWRKAPGDLVRSITELGALVPDEAAPLAIGYSLGAAGIHIALDRTGSGNRIANGLDSAFGVPDAENAYQQEYHTRLAAAMVSGNLGEIAAVRSHYHAGGEAGKVVGQMSIIAADIVVGGKGVGTLGRIGTKILPRVARWTHRGITTARRAGYFRTGMGLGQTKNFSRARKALPYGATGVQRSARSNQGFYNPNSMRAMLEARYGAGSVQQLSPRGPSFGSASTSGYARTFFREHPELRGNVVIHHAVEQQVLTRYPGIVSKGQMHSLENLRGIPKAANSRIHLREIRRAWDRFYRANPNPSANDLLDHARYIDNMYGAEFTPPVHW